MSVQVDHVPGLLAAEYAALTPERLEHVPVSHVRRHDAHASLVHEPVEPEVRHLGHGDEVDAEMEGEHGEDRVAVELVPGRIHRQHAIAVAVEGDAEVEAALAHRADEEREIGRAAAGVDVRPVGPVTRAR